MRFIKIMNIDGSKTKVPVLNETDKLGFMGGFMLGLIYGGVKAFAELEVPSISFVSPIVLEEQFLLLLTRGGWTVTEKRQTGEQVYIEAAKDVHRM